MIRRTAGFLAMVAIAGILAGCGSRATDEELFDQAHEINVTYKAAVAEVQLIVLDGEWENEGYGDAPRRCEGSRGYSFEMRRGTPPDWHLSSSATTTARSITSRLSEAGWTNVEVSTYTEGIADVVVTASQPGAYVDEILIDIKPDPATYDIVTITARSTCQPGDWLTISEMRHPGNGDREQLPRTEHPNDKPSFGHTPDGKRRFWDETGD